VIILRKNKLQCRKPSVQAVSFNK